MRWLKHWLGLTTPLEKKKKRLSALRHEAFYAVRDGDLRKAGRLGEKAEELEDEIVKMLETQVCSK